MRYKYTIKIMGLIGGRSHNTSGFITGEDLKEAERNLYNMYTDHPIKILDLSECPDDQN